ncbi:MAG: extracellular solute-binding protein [Alphaproteobacteria bacterium]|nr:extracellular solute-binding protein [Alphaproteobacteria bacterium]
MRRLSWILCGLLIISMQQALADPVADRAIAGAKAYIKAKNLKEPKLTVLLSSLYNNSFPDFAKKWEELTGVKMEIVPLGYTDIPAKIMQEGVAKTGVYDIFNDFPYTTPDAAGAKVVIPLDDYAKKYKPDFSGVADGLQFQQYYDGKLYIMVNDGDHLILALRKDLVENPQVRADYKAKFNKDLGCPDTMAEWAQQAAFFQTKAGDTRWGIKFEQPLYGALGYRSVNFSYRHFPVYMKGLLFDKDMKPRIGTPDGIAAIKAFAASVDHMPKDIQGWGTPQIYPFWASGQAYSAMSFPSIIGFANGNPKSVIKGKQIPCIIPGNVIDGKLVRRAPQAAGTGYMVSAYSKNPELAYLFIQWFTSPTVGDQAVAHPRGFWDPYRDEHVKNKAINDRFGADMVKTTIENSKYAASLLMIEGNYEYFKILDNNLADVMNKNISAEEAAKRIEAGWNRVTNDVGRDTQIRIWRKGVESGIYLDKF